MQCWTYLHLPAEQWRFSFIQAFYLQPCWFNVFLGIPTERELLTLQWMSLLPNDATTEISPWIPGIPPVRPGECNLGHPLVLTVTLEIMENNVMISSTLVWMLREPQNKKKFSRIFKLCLYQRVMLSVLKELNWNSLK